MSTCLFFGTQLLTFFPNVYGKNTIFRQYVQSDTAPLAKSNTEKQYFSIFSMLSVNGLAKLYTKEKTTPCFRKTVFLFCVSEHYLCGKAAAEKEGVHPILFWWRRGESNPCPKAHSHKLLRVQNVV